MMIPWNVRACMIALDPDCSGPLERCIKTSEITDVLERNAICQHLLDDFYDNARRHELGLMSKGEYDSYHHNFSIVHDWLRSRCL